MGFPIGKVFTVGTGVLGAILRAVPIVEAIANKHAPLSDGARRASVLELVQAELTAAETIVGRDLANDTDVLAAAGAVNDAVVAFHKLLARKALEAGV